MAFSAHWEVHHLQHRFRHLLLPDHKIPPCGLLITACSTPCRALVAQAIIVTVYAADSKFAKVLLQAAALALLVVLYRCGPRIEAAVLWIQVWILADEC